MSYALRLYDSNGEETGSLLCDFGPDCACPQWHSSAEKRLKWPTAEEARDYLFLLRQRYPDTGIAGFADQDIRVVCVVPPVHETYVEITVFERAPE